MLISCLNQCFVSHYNIEHILHFTTLQQAKIVSLGTKHVDTRIIIFSYRNIFSEAQFDHEIKHII